MRILLVHTRYRQPGGEDAVVRTEGEMLVGAGHDVALDELSNPESSGEAALALARAPWNRAAAAEVVARAREFRADVVHVHNTWFALSPAVFSALSNAGFPTVATMHNYRLTCVNALLYRDRRICEECLGHLPWRGVVHRCYRGSTLQSAAVAVTIATHRLVRTWHDDVDRVVALTDFAADRLVASGVPRARIVVKPNVVVDPGPRTTPPSRSRTVLFVGRMTEDKGVLDLLAAWERISADLDLVMVGDGPLLDGVRSRGIPRLTAVGRESADQVATRMAGARSLIFPSRWYEGLPMVVLEAMASGLGTVAPDHGALPGIVGQGGLTFPSGRVSGLAEAIEAIGSDSLVDRLGGDARQRYLDEFTPESGIVRLERLYSDAIRERRGR